MSFSYCVDTVYLRKKKPIFPLSHFLLVLLSLSVRQMPGREQEEERMRSRRQDRTGGQSGEREERRWEQTPTHRGGSTGRNGLR